MPTTPSVNIVREVQQSASESEEETAETKHQFHEENAGEGSGRTKQRQSMRKSARDAVDEVESPNPRDGEETVLSTLFIDADGLSRPGIGTRARLEDSSEQGLERLNKIHGAVRTILECIGEDPNRLGVLNTPERYAQAMMFLTQGYGQNVWDIVNNAIFHEDYNEIVVVKDIQIFSMCEHHMLPFMGKMHIGYVPYHSVIGISKLSRIAEMFGRRLQIQERLTKEVANAIMEVLKPQGVGVVMESSHLCMAIRGAEKSMAVTITSCVLGCFETNEKTRNEFLSLVSVRK